MNTKDLEKILKVLASKRRLDIMKFLKNNKESMVDKIAGEIKLSLKATSKHLRILYSADILERDKRGLEVYYRLAGNRDEIIRIVTRSIK